MKIETFKHVGVKPNGTFTKGRLGAVTTVGAIRMSKGEGCGLDTCNCSAGHWIMIAAPRTKKGVVEGIRVTFDNQKEMNKFLKNHELEM